MKYYVAFVEELGFYCIIGLYRQQMHGPVIIAGLKKEVADIMAHNLNASIRTEKLREPKSKYHCEFSINDIYMLYPRKEGKTHGFVTLMKDIQTQEDFELCLKAAKNYRDLVDYKYKTDRDFKEGFIKLFSTWARCWRDYVVRSPLLVAEEAKKPQQLTIDEISRMTKI